MRLFQKTKDGGDKSTVDAYFLCEFKNLFTIALLKFNDGSRENYHTHAFNAWTWFLKGSLEEHDISGQITPYKRSFFPKLTTRCKNHKVVSQGNSWCLTFRGPWKDTWTEHDLDGNKLILTHGRKQVTVSPR